MRVRQGSWSIQPLEQWEVAQDPECLTLTLSDDGALTLSSARKQTGFATPEDMQWCIDQLEGEWSETTQVSMGAFSGLHVSGLIDGIAWDWWMLGCGPVLLRASYNGTPDARSAELAQVVAMLSTLGAVEHTAGPVAIDTRKPK